MREKGSEPGEFEKSLGFSAVFGIGLRLSVLSQCRVQGSGFRV